MTAVPNLRLTEPVALFLDFDGTLVPIAARPDLAQVPPGLLTTLQETHKALDGALALVTGRSIASLDALLEPLRLPAAGIHGIEFRDTAGIIRTVPTTAIPAWARTDVMALAGKDLGLLLEDKNHSMALHYRQAPTLEGMLREKLSAIAAKLGPEFTIQDGKMVFELRPAAATKGTAITRFMSAAPYAGRQPVFIGDDVTDEDAFRIVNDMGGYSIKVGNRQPGSAAQHMITDVDAVREWLIPLTQVARNKN